MYLTDFINLSPVIHAPVCMHVGIIIWNVNTTIAAALKACTCTMYKKVITWRSSLPSNKCEQNMNISDYVMNCINQSRMPVLRSLLLKLLHKSTALSHCQHINSPGSSRKFHFFPFFLIIPLISIVFICPLPNLFIFLSLLYSFYIPYIPVLPFPLTQNC